MSLGSVLLAGLASGCTLTSAGRPAPSTIAPGSPWSGTFTVTVPPAPVNALSAVDCPTATSCWATGSTVGGGGVPNGAAVIATTNGGATWSPQVIPPLAAYLSGVSCSDQRACVAVGQANQSSGQGVIIATTDAGRSWQPRPVPPGALDVTTVTCRADRRCLAVADVAGGAVALWSASAGTAWVQRGALPAGMTGATGVSCTDDAHCWVTARRSPDSDHVAGTVAVTSDGGTTWTALTTPTGIGYLNGISCAASGTALPYSGSSAPNPGGTPAGSGSSPPTTAGAVSSATATGSPASTTGTSTPSAPSPGAPSPGAPTAPSVPGVACTAVGTTSNTLGSLRTGRGVILTTGNGGGSWSNQPVPAPAALLGVACTATDTCVLAGTSVSTSAPAGTLVLTGPPSRPWKGASVLPAAQALSAVSCVSESSCVVVGEAITEHLADG